MASIVQRFRSGWNAFLGRGPTNELRSGEGFAYSERPDRTSYRYGNKRSIVSSIYNRIAVDVSAIHFEHAKVDEDGNFAEEIPSDLNECLNLSANIDQTSKAMLQDLVQSMFDEGVVAVVPTDTDYDPTTLSEQYDVLELKVGKIIAWYPAEVTVRLYNERKGIFQDIRLPKSSVAIIENPFHSIMNEPNSNIQRLTRAISNLERLNDQNASGKLDLIIQLPYVVKSEQRKMEAEKRRSDLEEQLEGSTYGVAWTDGTERITQLNRSVENNLWEQVKDLTAQVYNHLGLTQGILDGTADEKVMINYYNNTITPICSAICDEFKRKFLSRTARTRGQSIVFFRDPFKLVPVSQLADIADKFRRNEIMTSNELRAKIGLRPSKAENAEELRNPNLNKANEELKQDGADSGGEQNLDDVTELINNVLAKGELLNA